MRQTTRPATTLLVMTALVLRPSTKLAPRAYNKAKATNNDGDDADDKVGRVLTQQLTCSSDGVCRMKSVHMAHSIVSTCVVAHGGGIDILNEKVRGIKFCPSVYMLFLFSCTYHRMQNLLLVFRIYMINTLSF